MEPTGRRNRSTTPYDQLGGAEAVRALVTRFYDLVETMPEAEPLRIMHLRGHGLAHARQEQFAFMSGFLGGPHLYAEQHGHANVRQMHAHLVIDAEARDAWLACMLAALNELDVDGDLKSTLMLNFTRVATMLQNA